MTTTPPAKVLNSPKQRSSAQTQPRVWLSSGLIGATALSAVAIVIAWCAGQNHVSSWFNRLASLQAHPPFWAQAPEVAHPYLLLPTVVLFCIAWSVTKASPQPKTWSRVVVISILLGLLIRYLGWRVFSTLNLVDPLNGTLSLLLLAMEMLSIAASAIQMVLLLRVSDRRSQADQLEVDVRSGCYTPTVDVLIPTYNEPITILRRTVMGCQAMEYLHKTVYLLDDTRRPEVQSLARELGCEYLARFDNRHAKAGNLNHAIDRSSSELIACFDADFVPTRNFLGRTLGFFQDPRVALLQTPQSFYNPDPVARNLGLETVLTPDEEVFYRQIQPMRDGVGGVVCSGTSFVVRRSALEKVGGFTTESLSEDYFTGIKLAAQGYKVIYLDEKLSAGLAAESIAAHVNQRIRWARGTLQAFFIDANPLTIPGLTLTQRLAHLEGLLNQFGSIPRLVFLLMPLAYTYLHVIPIQATLAEALYFFLPFYGVQLAVFGWLNGRSRSVLLLDMHALVLVFPLSVTVLQALWRPFAKGFQVTPKGINSDRFVFHWKLAWPLMVVLLLTALGLAKDLGWWFPRKGALDVEGLDLGWIWSVYNLVMVAIALLILLDVPNPEGTVWLELRRVVRLIVKSPGVGANLEVTSWWGITERISETGAEITLTQAGLQPLALGEQRPVTLVIAEASLALPAKLIGTSTQGGFPTAVIRFDTLAVEQQRALVVMLFCRPGQWKRLNYPGEWRSLWILVRVLCRPRFLTRDTRIKPLPTVQV